MLERNGKMRLEQLCEMELTYREEKAYGQKFVLMRPYGSEEGSGYGEGDGTVNGSRLKGTLRWVNHPHRRSDKVMLPNAHGIITTDDGALVMFALEGRTVFEGDKGNQLLVITFEAEDERYRWLNNTFCVFEGVIGAAALRVRSSRVYLCINELIDET
jgi:hypothetical protein